MQLEEEVEEVEEVEEEEETEKIMIVPRTHWVLG